MTGEELVDRLMARQLEGKLTMPMALVRPIMARDLKVGMNLIHSAPIHEIIEDPGGICDVGVVGYIVKTHAFGTSYFEPDRIVHIFEDAPLVLDDGHACEVSE